MADNKTKPFVPERAWRAAVAGILFAAFLIVDQVTKVMMRDAVSAGFTSADFIPGILELRFAMNTGAAFSLGEGFGFVFVILALAVVVFTVVYLWRAPLVSRLEVVGLGMLAGGAVGNAIDRMLFGFVTDFFATTFISFPVFNVADIGITCGAVIAFVGFLLSPANREGADERAEKAPRGGDSR